MDLGKSIKVACAMKGETQTKLAKAMAISEQTVTSWVKGNSSPRLNQIGQVAYYFDMPVSVFISLGESEGKG